MLDVEFRRAQKSVSNDGKALAVSPPAATSPTSTPERKVVSAGTTSPGAASGAASTAPALSSHRLLRTRPPILQLKSMCLDVLRLVDKAQTELSMRNASRPAAGSSSAASGAAFAAATAGKTSEASPSAGRISAAAVTGDPAQRPDTLQALLELMQNCIQTVQKIASNPPSSDS